MRISDWSSDVCSSDLPVAFLITELVELATLINPHAIMHISAGGSAAVESQPMRHRATLRVQSEALVASPAMSDYLHHRFGRILTGLSRQLRAPLEHDVQKGEYAIAIAL